MTQRRKRSGWGNAGAPYFARQDSKRIGSGHSSDGPADPAPQQRRRSNKVKVNAEEHRKFLERQGVRISQAWKEGDRLRMEGRPRDWFYGWTGAFVHVEGGKDPVRGSRLNVRVKWDNGSRKILTATQFECYARKLEVEPQDTAVAPSDSAPDNQS